MGDERPDPAQIHVVVHGVGLVADVLAPPRHRVGAGVERVRDGAVHAQVQPLQSRPPPDGTHDDFPFSKFDSLENNPTYIIISLTPATFFNYTNYTFYL